MGVVLKNKIHIIDNLYKVSGFMETVNDNMEVEVGMGNNRVNPKPSETISYMKIRNTNPDMKMQIRLAKAGKEKRCITLGPGEECDAVSIFFQGAEAPTYHMEAVNYVQQMLQNVFDVSLMDNADYTNSEQIRY